MANRLTHHTAEKIGFVTGHDFSRAVRAAKSTRALENISQYRAVLYGRLARMAHRLTRHTAEMIGFVTGHDFSRAVRAAKSKRALAPEGSFLAKMLVILPFFAVGAAGSIR
jgi:hypothetical protein